MVRLLAELAQAEAIDNVYVGEGQVRRLRAAYGELHGTLSAPGNKYEKKYQRVRLGLDLGRAELQLGNEREALERLLTAYGEVKGETSEGVVELANEIRFALAIAYFRLGETENCVHGGGSESCIFPIREAGVHGRREGTTQAVQFLAEYLSQSERDAPRRRDALWLLNLAHMTLGDYPQGVPEAYRIHPQGFASEVPFPRFRDRASDLGLDTFSLAGGAIGEDFDGDGTLDLMVSTSDPSGQLRLFSNRGDGTFEERTEEANLTGLFGGLNLLQGDYDNDGHVDVLVLRGAWNFHRGQQPNSLLRNRGDGSFVDVTFEAGLGERHFPSQTAAWADYDRDGDLDLYIGNESFEGVFFPGELFRNRGDGTFEDVARAAGVENDDMAKAVAWGDFDGDLWPDLFISNYMGYNRLYHNRGDGTFVDIAGSMDLQQPVESFPAWFWDYDNDGALDLFVSSYGTRIGDVAAGFLGQPVAEGLLPRLLRGDGQGKFQDRGRQAHLLRPLAPMGANFGDLNNDGFLDVYFGTGWPNYESLMPNVMILNQGGKRFVDVTTAGGFGHLQKGHGVVFADWDHDGDLDLFQQIGGFYRGDAFRDALYENPGFGNRWVALELVGTRSNRSAIGARLRLDITEDGRSRSIYRWVGSGASFGANPLRQTIGLGQAERVDRLEVQWPATGQRQVFERVAVGAFYRLLEAAPKLTVLDRPAFRLGPRELARQQTSGP